MQNAAGLTGPVASSEGLLVPVHPALDFQNVGLQQNYLGCLLYKSHHWPSKCSGASLSIFAMNESDSACETLGRWSWDTLLLTSGGHLVPRRGKEGEHWPLLLSRHLSESSGSRHSNLGPDWGAGGHSGKHTCGGGEDDKGRQKW